VTAVTFRPTRSVSAINATDRLVPKLGRRGRDLFRRSLPEIECLVRDRAVKSRQIQQESLENLPRPASCQVGRVIAVRIGQAETAVCRGRSCIRDTARGCVVDTELGGRVREADSDGPYLLSTAASNVGG